MIEVTGVVKRFVGEQSTTAVDQVSFVAERGEVLGILGPNGAGKTTLLRMVTTLLRPDEGIIRVGGHDVVQTPAAVRAQLGFVSTTTGLYERLTPREVLTAFGHLQGVPHPARRTDELIERFHIGDFANKRCGELSTGMKQKVSIARAVVHDPPLLVMDEPTAGLDVLVAQTFLDYVAEARKAGRCVLYSTHIMAEAQRMCDRIGILHRGQLHALGTMGELREQTGEHYLEDVFLQVVRGEER